MDIKVKTFAGLKELLGGEIVVNMPKSSTIEDLERKILSISPESERLLSISAFVVDDSIVEKEFSLIENSLVYLLPPCSGG
ncbi:MAG: MoaD/ThiS family protein [Leptospiraceae bacterium]|nr:MoaD/ThiS family protein [Leptospiraceae bacterium]MCK6379877.1 MoaD/ThiS family protein [Leptospiraceae bacterium]